MRWLPFAVAALVSAAHAQPVALRLRLLEDRPYHQRELVRAQLTEAAREWPFAGFLLDPPHECGTVAKPCSLSQSGIMPGFGPGAPSPSLVLVVNHYLPDLPPGRYRLQAFARRMVFTATGGSTIGRYAEPPEYATSDPQEFEIAPATPAWVRDTVAYCVATLRAAAPRTPSEHEARQAAAEQLAWLDTPASREAALDLLSVQPSLLLDGLRSTRDPASVCEHMQARVPAPAQSVSTGYLYAAAELCAKAHLPPPPPLPGRGAISAVIATAPLRAAPVAAPDPATEAWIARRTAYLEDIWNRATAALAASLPAKLPEARWDAFATLLERVSQLRVNRPTPPEPPWIPTLTAAFVDSFPEIEVSRRRYLLDLFTAAIRSPAVVPLLERILDSWQPGDYYETVHSAIRTLHAIDPPRAQARIRAELTRPQTWLDTPQLDLLPPAAVPPMDDALIDALARAQRPPGWNAGLRMAAIARYATPAAQTRIQAIYQSQEQPCQPELLAYFVRVDPAFAEHVFHLHPWDMHAAPPPCTLQIFERTSRLAMSPGLEQYLAAYLMHSDVHVKTTAARVLGRYGTPTALPRLWDTLRYFHEWWQGKGAELAANQEGVLLEVELRNAIARGRAWLATPADLRRIESLCLSDWCRGETQADLRAWDPPLRIEVRDRQYSVAQYTGLESLAALEAKLAQFPPGTEFIR